MTEIVKVKSHLNKQVNSDKNKENSESSGGYTLPGHNYLGPGNKIGNTLPQNSADWTALDHDIAYTEAKNYDDILKADNKAIDEFLSNPISIGNVGGAVGLQAKKFYEQAFGPIYPKAFNPIDLPYNNPHSRNRIDDFDRKQDEYFNSKDNSSGRVNSTNSNTNSSIGVMSGDDRRDQNVPLPTRKDGKPFNRGNLAYAARQQELAKRRRIEKENNQNTSNTAGGQQPGPSTSGVQGGASTSGMAHQGYMPPIPYRPQMVYSEAGPMDIDLAERRGVNQQTNIQSTSDSGPEGATLRTFSPDRLIHLKNTIKFGKNFFLMTYGFAYKIIKGGQDGSEIMTTPLFALPIEFPFLYMSPGEYRTLPPRCRAVQCIVKVTPMGFRTSFATGQSTSTYANAAHSMFGIHGIGLNKELFAYNVAYSTGATNEMVPETIARIANDAYTKVLYGDDNTPGCVSGMHRHINCYLTLIKDTTNGYPPLKNYMTEYDILPHMGKPIINFKFDFPERSYLKTPGAVIPIATTQTATDDVIKKYRTRAAVKSQIHIIRTKSGSRPKLSHTQITGSSFWGNYPQDLGLNSSMMAYDNSHLHHENTYDVAPWLYFGVQPVQANVPSSEDQYSNVCIHYAIETELIIEVDSHSDFINSERRYAYHSYELNTQGFDKNKYNLANIAERLNNLPLAIAE